MNLEQEKTTLSTDCMSACIQHAQSGMKKKMLYIQQCFYIGTIHLRRRHFLGGKGVKNLPNLPTDSSRKTAYSKGGFYSESAIRFLDLQIPKTKYSEKLS